ncbi:hypothetical protein [Caenimonas koreensis]|uniref:hypothetical protein n=1 Tax=Caenimonas koreensis TaxID=367474 RepID=UPI0037832559
MASNKARKLVAEAGIKWDEILGDPVDAPPKSNDKAKEDAPPAGTSPDAIKHQTAEDMAANRGLRERYADKAHKLASGCICMWAVFLASQGVIKAVTGVEMWSEKVIIAVTAGVTVNVLAAFLGVIRGLFPNVEKRLGKKR